MIFYIPSVHIKLVTCKLISAVVHKYVKPSKVANFKHSAL